MAMDLRTELYQSFGIEDQLAYNYIFMRCSEPLPVQEDVPEHG